MLPFILKVTVMVATSFREHKKYLSGVFKTKDEILIELAEKGITKVYHVLSFGGGTQSTHLLEAHFKGEIHYDFIIMSDTGAEPGFIHDQVAWWKKRQKEFGNTTPFIITNHGSMPGGIEEMIFRYLNTNYQRLQLPLYCAQEDAESGNLKHLGIMPRQCTVDFKIVPVKQLVRQLILKEHDLGPRQRMPKDVSVIIDLGFSVDEIRRISTYKSPQFKYMYLAYPLVEMNKTTQDSINYLAKNNMPLKRSRCYLCPFNCDMQGMDWREIIEDEPLSFLKACHIDDMLRVAQKFGGKILKSIPFLHYSRTPLREVYEAEYESLMRMYGPDVRRWLHGWQSLIEEKYGDLEVDSSMPRVMKKTA